MTPAVYLIVGALLAVLAMLAVRWREKTLITPGALLLGFYGVHCFVDPTLRYLGVHPNGFNLLTWKTLTIYNVLCYGALVVGYLLPWWPLHRDKERYIAVRPARMFERTGFFWAATACTVVLGMLFVGMALLGRFTLPAIVFNFYRPGIYELLISLYPVLFLVVPAVFVSAWFDASSGRRFRRFAAGALVAGVVLYNLALLGRLMALSVLVTIGIVWHFRYRQFGVRHVAGAVLVVALVNGGALLRRIATGLTGIDLESIRQLAVAGGLTFMDGIFSYVVMISEGQVVLSNTIAFVEETGLFGGGTYLDSVLSRTLPNHEPLLPQPKPWYEIMTNTHRLGVTSFDFSILAEAYMNFGRAGAFFFLFLGALVRYLSYKVYTACSPVMLLWSAWMIVVLLVATRGDSLALFMRMSWYIVPLIALRVGAAFFDGSTRTFRDGKTAPASPGGRTAAPRPGGGRTAAPG